MRVAEDAAVLDALSGRLQLGLANGGAAPAALDGHPVTADGQRLNPAEAARQGHGVLVGTTQTEERALSTFTSSSSDGIRS